MVILLIPCQDQFFFWENLHPFLESAPTIVFNEVPGTSKPPNIGGPGVNEVSV